MQRDKVDVIADHEELVRDMRGVWFSDRENLSSPLGIVELRIVDEGDTGEIEEARESMEYLTDGNYTRQGIGMHIDRQTREVYVTHVLC
jgi:anti-sigma regulatory factor (Ser/Thr protein kinase)